MTRHIPTIRLIALILSITAGAIAGCNISSDRPDTPSSSSESSAPVDDTSPTISGSRDSDPIDSNPIDSSLTDSNSTDLGSLDSTDSDLTQSAISNTSPPLSSETQTNLESGDDDNSSASDELNNQPAIALTCSGRIQEGPDFIVYYMPDEGFSHIDFGTSEHTVVSDLTFNTYNKQGQEIWRGSAYGRADVTLVALSTEVLQPGNEVSVNYDTRWGRAICEEAQGG